jgi:predicted MPP superfamily phosphohydrolase
MRFYFPFIVIAIILIIIDLIIFFAIRRSFSDKLKPKLNKIFVSLFWVISAGTIGGLGYIFLYKPDFSDVGYYQSIFRFNSVVMLFYIPKLFMLAILMIGMVLRFGWMAVGKMIPVKTTARLVHRTRTEVWTAIMVGLLIFLFTLHGITIGKFNFQIREVNFSHHQIPEPFDGFRIVQISDLHISCFLGHEDRLLEAVNLINGLQPDVIVFTGDMVNNNSAELAPMIHILKELKAPHKLAILGNHDYGDYTAWLTEEEKALDHQNLTRYIREAGFELLLNENQRFRIQESDLYNAGVENIGKPPIPQYGDMNTAMLGIPDTSATILLSHDPSHWEMEVTGKRNIILTLAGHTHGAQFGFDFGRLRWSPVQWKYSRWKGLYEKNGQFLYVNPGLGHIGYAGRAGIFPEITLFILSKASS